MKIDSVDSVTSYEAESKPLDNGEKFQMSNKPKIKAGSSLSAPIYIPYKPVNLNQQAKKAYNYYIGRGVKPNVAAGIVGNLYKESGLNPNAVGDKGTAYGVAQWRGNRLSNLKNYAAKKGRSYSDLNTQLDYILDEQGENNVLKEMNNQTPEQAAMTFANKYERPNPKYADYSTRSSVAKQLGQMKYGGIIPKFPDGKNLKKPSNVDKNLNSNYDIASQRSYISMNLAKRLNILGRNIGSNDPEKIKEEYNKQIANMYNTHITDDVYVVGNRDADVTFGFPKKNKDVIKKQQYAAEKTNEAARVANSSKGFYDGYSKSILLKNNLENPNSTALHELTHSLEATPQENQIKSFIPQKDDYYDDASEIYSRRNEFMKANNINPTKKYTLDEVKKMRKDSNIKDFNILKRYKDDEVLFLLNDVAMNNKSNKLHQARYGGIIPRLQVGGYLPKHGLGAGTILNLISGASTATAGLVDSFNDPDNPKQGLSAISGALQGNAAIPGVGLILGAVSGLKNAQKQKELFEKKEMMKNNQTMDYFKVRSKGILEDYNTQGNQGSFYAKGGGIANPQYEVEHGEVVMGDDVQLTGGQKLASNLHKVVGKTHEQYNPNTVNGTGEDGSGGEFVFSNRLKLGNKTFAQHAETIAKQKAKSEKASNHNDYIFKNTANANIELADSKLQQLAQIQETMKEKANKYGYYKFGGFIPKYGEGEDLEKEAIKLAKRGIFRTSSEQKRLVEISKRLEQLKANNVYKPASQPYIEPREITLPEVRVVGKRPSVKTITLPEVRVVGKRPSVETPREITSPEVRGEGEDLEKEAIKLAKRGIFRTSSEQKRLVEISKRLEQLKANNTSKIQRNSVYKPASQPYSVKRPEEITLPEVRVVGKRPSVKTTTSSKKATEPIVVNPNELTVAQRGALRNQNLAASTNSNAPVRNNTTRPVRNNTTRPVGNTNQQTPQATEPIVDNRINYEVKPLAIKQFDNTPNKLPDVSNRVNAEAAAKALSTKPGVGGGDKSKLDWTTAAVGLMSGLNYMTNNNMINNYKTNVPVSLMQNPNYQYFDRSGLARHSVRGLTNSVMNNPFINQAGKQMAFANSLNATNEIEQQEANRKMDYDRQYRAQLLDTENRNSMILNRAREQQLANENTKLGLRQENLNNMFTNINTALSENAAMKSNERAMQYLGAAYINRLGITPEEFAKDPLGILTGKKENVDKQKMGGFIKLKGYKNASK